MLKNEADNAGLDRALRQLVADLLQSTSTWEGCHEKTMLGYTPACSPAWKMSYTLSRCAKHKNDITRALLAIYHKPNVMQLSSSSS
jgi:hypothetical protein